jgi:hypothetical protein
LLRADLMTSDGEQQYLIIWVERILKDIDQSLHLRKRSITVWGF